MIVGSNRADQRLATGKKKGQLEIRFEFLSHKWITKSLCQFSQSSASRCFEAMVSCKLVWPLAENYGEGSPCTPGQYLAKESTLYIYSIY